MLRESANYYNQRLICNGILYLTSDELIFVSHKEKDALEARVPIINIKNATYGKVFKHLVGLKIIMHDGSEMGFVVNRPENFIEKITALTEKKPSD